MNKKWKEVKANVAILTIRAIAVAALGLVGTAFFPLVSPLIAVLTLA